MILFLGVFRLCEALYKLDVYSALRGKKNTHV